MSTTATTWQSTVTSWLPSPLLILQLLVFALCIALSIRFEQAPALSSAVNRTCMSATSECDHVQLDRLQQLQQLRSTHDGVSKLVYPYPIAADQQLYDRPQTSFYHTGFLVDQTVNLWPTPAAAAAAQLNNNINRKRQQLSWQWHDCWTRGHWFGYYTQQHLSSEAQLDAELNAIHALVLQRDAAAVLSLATMLKEAPPWIRGKYPKEWRKTPRAFASQIAFEYRVPGAEPKGWVWPQQQQQQQQAEPHADAACPALRDFDPKRFLARMSGQRIFLLGDSLMRQMFEDLSDALESSGDLISTTTTIMTPDAVISAASITAAAAAIAAEQIAIDVQPAVQQLHHNLYRQNVTVSYAWLSSAVDGMPLATAVHPAAWKSDFLLFNVGAWYHAPYSDAVDTVLLQKLESELSSFALFLRQHYGGLAVYREYAPFHPGNDSTSADWEYKVGVRTAAELDQQPCALIEEAIARNLSAWRHGNRRVDAVNRIVTDAGVPMLLLFDASAQRPDDHFAYEVEPRISDCRHWMSNGGVLQLWLQLMDAGLVVTDMPM